MQDLPERIDSKFRFVLLAAERAEQMMRGAQPRVQISSAKPCRVAMEEIRQGLVEWDYGPAEPPESPEEASAPAADEPVD